MVPCVLRVLKYNDVYVLTFSLTSLQLKWVHKTVCAAPNLKGRINRKQGVITENPDHVMVLELHNRMTPSPELNT